MVHMRVVPLLVVMVFFASCSKKLQVARSTGEGNPGNLVVDLPPPPEDEVPPPPPPQIEDPPVEQSPFLPPFVGGNLPAFPISLENRPGIVGVSDRPVVITDINGDGYVDLLLGTVSGQASVIHLYLGNPGGTLHFQHNVYSGFNGGVFVAAGDLNGDGIKDIITGAGNGGAPRVRAFSGASLISGQGLGASQLLDFYAFDEPDFRGGIRVAAGDFFGDEKDEVLVAAGPGGGPRVSVYSGTSNNSELRTFFAFEVSANGGVYVAAGDVDGDGKADVIAAAGEGMGPRVRVLSLQGGGQSELHNFYAEAQSFQQGLRVTAFDYDGDGEAEILTAPGPGSSRKVRVFRSTDAGEVGNFDASASGNGIYPTAYQVPLEN